MGCCSSNDAIDENEQPGKVIELAVDHNVIDVDNWWKQHSTGENGEDMGWPDFLSSYTSSVVKGSRVGGGSGSSMTKQEVGDIILCALERSEEEVAAGCIARTSFLRFVLRFGPLDLTFEKVVNNIFSQYMAPDKTMRLMLASWFHGSSTSRHEINRLFRREPVGTFLVRYSETYPAKLTVSVVISAKLLEGDGAARSSASAADKAGKRWREGVVSNYLLSNEGQYGYSLSCSLPADAEGAASASALDDINSALYQNVFELLSSSPQLFKRPYPSKLYANFVQQRGAASAGPSSVVTGPRVGGKPSPPPASVAASPERSVGAGLVLVSPAEEAAAVETEEPDAVGYGVFEEEEEATEQAAATTASGGSGAGASVGVDAAAGVEGASTAAAEEGVEAGDSCAYGEFVEQPEENEGEGDDYDEDEEEAYVNAPAAALLEALCALTQRFDGPSTDDQPAYAGLSPTATLKQIVDRLRFQVEQCGLEVAGMGGDCAQAGEVARRACVGVRVGLGVLTVLACCSGAQVDCSCSAALCRPDEEAAAAVASDAPASSVGAAWAALKGSRWLELDAETRDGFLDLLCAAETGARALAGSCAPLELLRLYVEAFFALSRWCLLLHRLSACCDRNGVTPTSETALEAAVGQQSAAYLKGARELAGHALGCIRRLRVLTSNSSARSSPRVRVPADQLTIACLVEDFNDFQYECTSLYARLCLHAASTAVLQAVASGGAAEVEDAVELVSIAMGVASHARSAPLVAARSSSSSEDANDIKLLSVVISGHGAAAGEFTAQHGVNAPAWRTMAAYQREERLLCPHRAVSVFQGVGSAGTQRLLADGIRCFCGRRYEEANRLIYSALKHARCCGDVELEIRAAVNYGTVRYKVVTSQLESGGGGSEPVLPVLDELQEIIRLYVYSVGLVRELRSAKIVSQDGEEAPGHRHVDLRHDAAEGRTESCVAWLDDDAGAAALVAGTVAYYLDRAVQSLGGQGATAAAAVEVTSVDFERKVLFSLCQVLCRSLRFLSAASLSDASAPAQLAPAAAQHLYRANRVYFSHFIQQLLLICNNNKNKESIKKLIVDAQ